MKSRIVLFVIGFLLGYHVMTAQDYAFDHYGVKDQLVSDELYICKSDEDGLLWIGSEAGLFVYDGVEFTHIIPEDGPKYQSVYELYTGPDKKIWFLGSDGKIRNTSSNNHQEVIINSSPPTAFKMSFATTDDGSYWFGSYREGLYALHPDTNLLTHVLPDFYISAIYPRPGGLVLASTESLLFYHTESGLTDTILTTDNAYLSRSTRKGTGIYLASAKTLYVIDINHLLPTDTIPLLPGMQVIHASTSQNGNIVLGTRDGLFVLDASGNIKPHMLSKYLKEKAISYYHEDKVGNIWITTLNDGLYRFYKNPITKVTHSNIQPVRNLSYDSLSGDLFVGGKKGEFAIVNSEGSTSYHQANWRHDGEVLASIVDTPYHWIITDNSFTLQSGGREFRIVLPCRNYYYNASNNELYLVYLAGVFRISATQIEELSERAQKIFTDRTELEAFNIFEGDTKSIAVTSDYKKWFAGSFGLASYLDTIQNYNYHPLLDQALAGIYTSDSPILYISTIDEDILAYDTHQDSVWMFLSGQKACGRFIRDIAIDQDDMWIAHNKGVSKMNLATEELTCYGHEHGLPVTKINSILPNDSTVLFGTDMGLYHLTKSKITNHQSATINIAEISVDNENEGADSYTIADKQAYLKVKPNAIGNGEDLTYRYRFNNHNIYTTTSDKSIPLDRLNYGANTVTIQLVDRHDLTIAERKISIFLTRPWYKEPAFLMFVSFLLLALLYTGIVRSIVERIKQRIIERLRRLQPAPLKLSLKLTDGSFVQLLVDDVIYMKSSGNYIEVYTKDIRALTRMTMTKMMSEVEHATPLKQIHRSYLVNISKITSIDQRYIYIDEEAIPYSPTYKGIIDPLKEKLRLNIHPRRKNREIAKETVKK